MNARKVVRAALYARYSTEKQSEASVDDQFRVCERTAEREGFCVVARFSDAAISGGTANRPGYQSLLESARRKEFDAIVAEDLKRLWREQAEQWRCIKELIDLGVCIVTASGIDSRQKNFEIIASVIGAAAELDRKEIAYRTRRGLEGKAANGGAGGRAFGYIPAAMSGTGRVEINPAEAAIVVRIFEMYADGHSPRTIAGVLNAECVPSPGASWSRRDTGLNSKRRSKWVASAIHGDVRRGSGILNNERYCGRIVWGRMRWERGAADSSRRIASVVEDRSEWITHEEPRLRIVPEALWKRVKAAQADRTLIRTKVRDAATGRPATTLLAGLLTCESCGSRFIAVDARCYGCASHKNGGMAACTNTVRIKREKAEKLLLAEIEAEILSDEAIALAQRIAQDELKRQQKPSSKATTPPSAKLKNIEKQTHELQALVKAGTLSPHVAKAALETLDRERAELLAKESRRDVKAAGDVVRLIPQTASLYREAVRNINELASEPVERMQARALIGEMLGGNVTVRPSGEAELRLDSGVLFAAGNSSQINCFQVGSGGVLPHSKHLKTKLILLR